MLYQLRRWNCSGGWLW